MNLEKKAGTRTLGKGHIISYEQTLAFFDARGRNVSANQLTATMYQDSVLAAKRDEAEKRTALPLLGLHSQDRVLDLGCGAGRWAEEVVPTALDYLGIDFSENLLEAARLRFPRACFQRLAVNSLNAAALKVAPPFTLVLCSGILAYINDADLLCLFETLGLLAATESRIYVREPIAKTERLTLDEYWSEDLQSSYSAIYRTRVEYLNMFRSLVGFRLQVETEPFPAELQNRIETKQHCFLLERRSSW
jgi:SAM-dependent methyltransferase